MNGLALLIITTENFTMAHLLAFLIPTETIFFQFLQFHSFLKNLSLKENLRKPSSCANFCFGFNGSKAFQETSIAFFAAAFCASDTTQLFGIRIVASLFAYD